MLRFKPCPSFVFLSPKIVAICLSCNFVAKVRIIFETTKLFRNYFSNFCKISFTFPTCHFSVTEIPPRRAPGAISTSQS